METKDLKMVRIKELYMVVLWFRFYTEKNTMGLIKSQHLHF